MIAHTQGPQGKLNCGGGRHWESKYKRRRGQGSEWLKFSLPIPIIPYSSPFR